MEIVKGVITDNRFWTLLVSLVNALWIHFVAPAHPEFNDILVVLDGFIALIALYVVKNAVVQIRARILAANMLPPGKSSHG